MVKRSYRVSESFVNKLAYIQEQAKLDGLPKTQDQIFDEMINLYILYKADDKEIFITDEIQKQVININNIFITKQAKMLNALMENISRKIDSM